MTTRPVLSVMARWPGAGRCKRRLGRDLDRTLALPKANERAARIQRRLCNHTLAVARELQASGTIRLSLAVSGLGPRCARRWGQALGADTTRLQGGGSLGSRLSRQIIKTRRRHRTANQLMIGTDLPALSCHDLLDAMATLEHNDVVLGPATDGGYWLIGLSANLLNQPECWPFSGIPWGGSSVLESTLQLCHQAQLKTGLLQLRDDIDHLRDLQPWLSL